MLFTDWRIILIKKFNVEKIKQLNKINNFLSFLYKKPVCGDDVNLNEVENILVIDFALMGDMIMNIPFFKTIRHNCPKAKITMVGMSWSEIILSDQGLVDEFIIFNGKDKLCSLQQILINFKDIRNILKIINFKNYELGFEPKGDIRHTLFLHYTNCNRTISYNYTGGEYLITDSFIPRENTKHLIDEKLDLLELSGFTIYDEDKIPELKLSHKSKDLVRDFAIQNSLKGKRVIGIHPGASNVNKQYRYYPELIEQLSTVILKKDIFCVFEGPGEEKIVDAVCAQLKRTKITYLRIKRKIKDYVTLVSICDYMICNDSAAGHIASAYGIPTLIIFGPVKPETALPRGKNRIEYVSNDLGCKPCTLPTCPLGTEECIQNITVYEVYKQVSNLMMKEGIKKR